MEKYMEIMKDSLMKKERILKELLKLCENQKEIISREEVDWDSFDGTVDAKGELVEELVALDDAFQDVFDRIKGELERNKDAYREDIRAMQDDIRAVTELSMRLETEEHRNKTLIEAKFRESRQQIKQTRIGSQVAANYYKKMNKINMVDPQLMDKKS